MWVGTLAGILFALGPVSKVLVVRLWAPHSRQKGKRGVTLEWPPLKTSIPSLFSFGKNFSDGL